VYLHGEDPIPVQASQLWQSPTHLSAAIVNGERTHAFRHRNLYVPEDLLQILSEHVRLHVPGDDPDRWMFTDRDGVQLHQNSAGYL
jgi:hypothetical protein